MDSGVNVRSSVQGQTDAEHHRYCEGILATFQAPTYWCRFRSYSFLVPAVQSTISAICSFRGRVEEASVPDVDRTKVAVLNGGILTSLNQPCQLEP